MVSATKKILIIDDVEENADILRVKLRHEGFEVLVAGDGESGLEMARRDRPDLVLCDIMLPKMDGWEVLKSLRADPNLVAVPVIFMTAYTTIQYSGERRRAQEEGAVEYVKKPFDLSAMAGLVRKHLGM